MTITLPTSPETRATLEAKGWSFGEEHVCELPEATWEEWWAPDGFTVATIYGDGSADIRGMVCDAHGEAQVMVPAKLESAAEFASLLGIGGIGQQEGTVALPLEDVLDLAGCASYAASDTGMASAKDLAERTKRRYLAALSATQPQAPVVNDIATMTETLREYRQALEWIVECGTDYQSIIKARNALSATQPPTEEGKENE